jgi:hypothetical protein
MENGEAEKEKKKKKKKKKKEEEESSEKQSHRTRDEYSEPGERGSNRGSSEHVE